jgi:hypothetical protein
MRKRALSSRAVGAERRRVDEEAWGAGLVTVHDFVSTRAEMGHVSAGAGRTASAL